MRKGDRQAGMSLIELSIALGIISVLTAVALPGFVQWRADLRVKGAARAVSDALLMARMQAMSTGRTHLVTFDASVGATAMIEIADDGLPGAGNCAVDAGESVHRVGEIESVVWGTTVAQANTVQAPDDEGAFPSSMTNGFTFGDGDGAQPAKWVLFEPDGLPRPFTPTGCVVGEVGSGAGAVYLSNGRRDYAIVMGPLGTTRVHPWVGASWRP
ncbi:type II secretion system GspH family protein [Myxococcota bacterium]|nr:type II secretion system GspH family protein [Myxococcota bacterium]